MALTIDVRLPVSFGQERERRTDDALLIEGKGAPAAGLEWFTAPGDSAHRSGCPCCAGERSDAALAMTRLLRARTERGGFAFRRVLAITETDAGRVAIEDAMTADPLITAYCRLV